MYNEIKWTTTTIVELLNSNSLSPGVSSTIKSRLRTLSKIGIIFENKVDVRTICNHERHPISVALFTVKGYLCHLPCQYEAHVTSLPNGNNHFNPGHLVFDRHKWDTSIVLSAIKKDWPKRFKCNSNTIHSSTMSILMAHPNDFIRTIARLLNE